MRLKDKVAIVTGTASGIGRERDLAAVSSRHSPRPRRLRCGDGGGLAWRRRDVWRRVVPWRQGHQLQSRRLRHGRGQQRQGGGPAADRPGGGAGDPLAGGCDARFREAIRLGQAAQLAAARIATGDNALTASAPRAGKLLGLAIANLITLFAPPRVVLVGTTFALGEPLTTALRSALDRTLPPGLMDVSEMALYEEADEMAWARGAAAAALRELYGAPWSTTGPARPRNSSIEAEREAE